MTEHSARGVTATELVAELEREFRTGAAIAECHGPGTRFVVSLGVDLLPAQGREVAALLARAAKVDADARAAKAHADAQAALLKAEAERANNIRATKWAAGAVLALVVLCLIGNVILYV
ncbi:hypothetical protein [Mameliella alba]|uniref:Uncharacterized protein n=1 Tax=Mameliella alba TaxID=561184 RepID=A0A0B3S107_9RHOB|nr:hypothetical protein [Mameliella alba]KHQ50301.1 hypothetical protein OA50_05149 [Mameliella alba]